MVAATQAAKKTQGVRDTASQFLILAGGIATTLATIGINWLVARWFEVDFLSFSFWFVIPAGAIIGGMGAAGGYYAVARLTQTMPSKSLLFNMVAVGISSWFLYHWIEYTTLTLADGTKVQDIASFWRFFTIQAENMQLSIGNSTDTGPLGALGYVREGLQLLGFMAGGLAVYAFLSEEERCETCSKYALTAHLLKAVDAGRFDDVLERSDLVLPGIVEAATAALGTRALAGLDLTLLECPKCHVKWLRPSVVIVSGNSHDRVPLMRYAVSDEQAAQITREARPASKLGVID